MKIRKGFVTNSSSSSFILGFKSEESIKEELQKENLEEEYFEEILRDVTEAAKLDRGIFRRNLLSDSLGDRRQSLCTL